MNLAGQIERHLLSKADWVSAAELVATFSVDERQLRQDGDLPGLCTGYAISGPKGFKHVKSATTAEWLSFKHRLRRHGISELGRVSRLDRVRHEVKRAVASVLLERDSAQTLMAI